MYGEFCRSSNCRPHVHFDIMNTLVASASEDSASLRGPIFYVADNALTHFIEFIF